MVIPPRRRWFAFRLRTLFVAMALFAIPWTWGAYQLEWIRQRRAFLQPGGPCEKAWFGLEVQESLGLKLFGEQGYMDIWLKPGADQRTIDRKNALFPEATLYIHIHERLKMSELFRDRPDNAPPSADNATTESEHSSKQF